MMKNVFVQKIKSKLPAVEFAERKGIGHPDVICDCCCEAAGKALSEYYVKNFGRLMHYNVDKGVLIAGKAKPRFGGGKIIEPMRLMVVGRATGKVGRRKIPVRKIIEDAVKRELSKFRYLERVDFCVAVKEGAESLQSIVAKKVCNDTSFGAAHYPLTELEKSVLDICNLLNGKLLKRFRFLGEDVKVMGIRSGKKFSFICSAAFVDRWINSMQKYIEAKEKIIDALVKITGFERESFKLNALDDYSREEDGVYLTVTGLSAEQGDDGNPGRGNRLCGLITPQKVMSLESVAGKNIFHPGRLYQFVAWKIAEKIGSLKGIKYCDIVMASEIGKPINEPKVVFVRYDGSIGKVRLKEKVSKFLKEAMNDYF
ncbi:hypothetical protein DRZ77_02950 [Candidatus Woesearchaeota archaeon]|nr:MAG: hypothetical protein DRZ77_02950 [Candidatus Woesearchaeota archaeon]